MGVLHLNGLPLLIGGAALHFGASEPAANASISISLLSRSAEQVAPEAVIFGVTGWSGFTASGPTGSEVYDARLHEIYYHWDFYYSGTDNSYIYSAPVNIYDGNARNTGGHANSRYAYGYEVSHTYRTAGTYTVRVAAVSEDGTEIAYATQAVTIGDADTLFSGTNTIFMSPAGTFGNAPAGARQITSGAIHTVYDDWVDGQESTPKRIMLNRGEAYTFTGKTLGSATDTPTTHIVAGPGGGAKPAITHTSAWVWDDEQTAGGIDKDFVMQDVVCNGAWDSTTPPFTGGFVSIYDTNPNAGNGTNPPKQALLDGVESYGVKVITENPSGPAMIWNDCIFYGFEYASSGSESMGYLHFTGNRIQHDPDAYCDATSTAGWALRMGGVINVYMASNDIFCRMTNTFDAQYAIQTAVRLNAEQHEGFKANLWGNCIEGGYRALANNPSGGTDRRAVNIVVEKNTIIGQASTVALVESAGGGFTCRNNILNWPNGAGRDYGTYSYMGADSDNQNAVNDASPVALYSNTCVNTTTDAAPVAITVGFSTVYTGNNILHEPNIGSPNVAYAPLGDDANTYFLRRWLGYRDTAEDRRAATTSYDTAGLYDLYDPEPTSAALGAATGRTAYDDFYGNVRPATKDVGAIQVST